MKEKKKRTPKQFAALICVIILAGMYLFTLIVACLDFPDADKWFAACLFATIGLPILLWVYLWLYGLMRNNRTTLPTDLIPNDSMQSNSAQNDSDIL